jgi:hypothetical protein
MSKVEFSGIEGCVGYPAFSEVTEIPSERVMVRIGL